MISTAVINEGLTAAAALLTEELSAMRQLVETAPMSVKLQISHKLPPYIDGLQQIEAGMEALVEIEEAYQALDARCDVHLRWQMFWRVLACKVILGRQQGDDLKLAAFQQFIKDPPTEEELREELHELAMALEQMEDAEATFGPLRSIQVDN
jgi:hypothetical protein